MKQIRTLPARMRGMVQDEDGAVTVDWIVLTAVVVLIGVAAAFSVGANIPGLANQISTVVSEQKVGA